MGQAHISSEVADDMRAFGLEDEIADIPVQEESESVKFEVWPENQTAVEVFLALATQWRTVATFGHLIRTGLDYTALPVVLEMRQDIDRKRWREIFNEIRQMETAALKTMRELRDKQQ